MGRMSEVGMGRLGLGLHQQQMVGGGYATQSSARVLAGRGWDAEVGRGNGSSAHPRKERTRMGLWQSQWGKAHTPEAPECAMVGNQTPVGNLPPIIPLSTQRNRGRISRNRGRILRGRISGKLWV